MQWTTPKIDGLTAAFFATSDGLVPADGQSDVSSSTSAAEQTAALWKSATLVDGAVMLIVNAETGNSIAMSSGPLIVEGRRRLNVGLVRAAARDLQGSSEAPSRPNHHVPTASPFRTAVWQILTRFHETHLPRIYSFDFGGKIGTVACQDGRIQFGNGFADLADFVDSLRSASEAGQSIAYTLESEHTGLADNATSTTEILRQIVETTDGTESEFDPDGWPLAISTNHDFGALMVLSTIAVAACAKSDDAGTLTLKILSEGNKLVVSGKTTEDRSVLLSLSQSQ